jgi:hypothetical protein
MNNSTISDQEIDRNQWNAVFTSITNEYRGVHARLEVFGRDLGDQTPTEDTPFQGISADNKDGENVVWIDFGDNLTRGVHGVKAVRMLAPAGGNGPVIEVAAEDGTKTLLRLGLPGEYALPRGERQ